MKLLFPLLFLFIVVSPKASDFSQAKSPISSSNAIAQFPTSTTPIAINPGPGPHSDESYRLRVGDKVCYQILEDREPSKILTVADSGELEIPCLGRVMAVGKSCRQLTDEIKLALETDYYYRATVVLALEQVNRLLGRVYVWGQVRNQGAVDVLVNEQLTAGKAILRAGGFAEFANRKRVKVIRCAPGQPNQVLEINMAGVLDEGQIDQDVPLRPDDAVIVASRVIRF